MYTYVYNVYDAILMVICTVLFCYSRFIVLYFIPQKPKVQEQENVNKTPDLPV